MAIYKAGEIYKTIVVYRVSDNLREQSIKMNQEQARRLVDETLGNDFDREKFIEFAGELLRDDLDTSENFLPLRNDVQGDFRYKRHERIETYEKIGSYARQLDILIIKLHRNVTLQRGRTTLREFAADYLVKGQGLGKTGVLAAFYSEGDDTLGVFLMSRLTFRSNGICPLARKLTRILPRQRFYG